MIDSKVDSQFLGTIQTSFKSDGLPVEVKIFFGFIIAGIVVSYLVYIIKKNKIHIEAKNCCLGLLRFSLGKHFPSFIPEEKEDKIDGKLNHDYSVKREVKVSSDREVIKLMMRRKMQIDVSVDRSGQRSLAGVVVVAESKGLILKCELSKGISTHLLQPGCVVKCIFFEMHYGDRNVNAFVGRINSISDDGKIAIERTSGFGFIRRRANARRKVADQRYIKLKMWKINPRNYKPGVLLDSVEPDILIDNRKKADERSLSEMVLDISKGGIAIKASMRFGETRLEVNDSVFIAMLMYSPKNKVFAPHLIQAEVRGSRSLGNSKFRLSFQFLRSLKVPPRKRSTLFKGQALMASDIEHSDSN